MKPEHLGIWVSGIAEAHEVQPKVISAKSGVHESTLSRWFNGIKDIDPRQAVKVGIAIGEARAAKAKAN